MRRILLTGSSGQIGTNLALRLVQEGWEVLGMDQRPNTWTDAFPTQLVDLSLPFPQLQPIFDQVPRVDAVVHFAANAKVHELVQQPAGAMKNIACTFNTLEFCRSRSLPVIFSSSREVYGDIHRYITSETDANFSFTESTYSASKVAGEALVYSYARCYGIRYIVFRFSNVYGRYDNDLERMERVIPLFIREIEAGHPITVFGAEKVLDFTYVDDCIAGVTAGLERLLAGRVQNVTVNLATGQGHTLVEAAELIGQALGRKPRVEVSATRVGEVRRYVADISAAQKLLSYQPTTPLSQGIPKAIGWHRQWNKGIKG